jgi:hypothetical protein
MKCLATLWMGTGVQFPSAARMLLFAAMSSLAPRPTKSPIHWVPGSPPLEVKQLEYEADT